MKVEDDGVDTVAEMCRWRAVVEYVAKMGFAFSADHFCSFHSMTIVGGKDDAAFADGLEEAGPAAGAVKFAIAVEEGVVAGSAIIGAAFFMIPVFSGESSFGALFAGNMVNV